MYPTRQQNGCGLRNYEDLPSDVLEEDFDAVYAGRFAGTRATGENYSMQTFRITLGDVKSMSG